MVAGMRGGHISMAGMVVAGMVVAGMVVAGMIVAGIDSGSHGSSSYYVRFIE